MPQTHVLKNRRSPYGIHDSLVWVPGVYACGYIAAATYTYAAGWGPCKGCYSQEWQDRSSPSGLNEVEGFSISPIELGKSAP